MRVVDSIAYGPFDDPRIVVAVIVEQGGYGTSSAAPIAKKILEAAFNINQPIGDVPKIYKPNTAL
jgi:penicillin-binding protein 2